MRLGIRIYHAMLFMLPILLIFSPLMLRHLRPTTSPLHTPATRQDHGQPSHTPSPLLTQSTTTTSQNALWLITCLTPRRCADPLQPAASSGCWEGTPLRLDRSSKATLCQSREAPATYPSSWSDRHGGRVCSGAFPRSPDTSVTVTLSGAAFLLPA